MSGAEGFCPNNQTAFVSSHSSLCDFKNVECLIINISFSKYDLYSKSDEVPDVEALRPYYQGLIDKYCPGQIQW